MAKKQVADEEDDEVVESSGELHSLKFVITGIAPLIMHNSQAANPAHPIVRQIKEISAKRKRTEEDELARQKLEWTVSLYWDKKIGPFIPSTVQEGCFRNGAKTHRLGAQVQRGLQVLNDAPLIYPSIDGDDEGPRNLEELWESGYLDIRPVKIQGSTIMRCRPLFKVWSIETEVLFDPSILNPQQVVNAVENGGKLHGFGDHRPKYGRFSAEVVTDKRTRRRAA